MSSARETLVGLISNFEVIAIPRRKLTINCAEEFQCSHYETIKHYLFDCSLYSEARSKIINSITIYTSTLILLCMVANS